MFWKHWNVQCKHPKNLGLKLLFLSLLLVMLSVVMTIINELRENISCWPKYKPNQSVIWNNNITKCTTANELICGCELCECVLYNELHNTMFMNCTKWMQCKWRFFHTKKKKKLIILLMTWFTQISRNSLI